MKTFYKILSVFILFTFSFFIFTLEVSSHTIGQPPYFKVNGTFTDYYPVPSSSSEDFKLPQDIAVGTFLINEAIEFEIDVNALPVPAEIVEKTKFTWEFGDGQKGEGLKNTHVYTKQGTYFLDIHADSGEGFPPQLLQSTAINVLPSKNYKIPESVIEINGKTVRDPLLDIIDVDFEKEINFSGSKSSGGGSQITEYFWDLGDQSSKTGSEFKYKYNQNPYTVFPVLRIKTADGFISDSFIQIKDGGSMGGFSENSSTNWPLIIGGILASLILAAILTFIISKLIISKRK